MDVSGLVSRKSDERRAGVPDPASEASENPSVPPQSCLLLFCCFARKKYTCILHELEWMKNTCWSASPDL